MSRGIGAVSHYKKPQKGLASSPILVNWALTNRCNFSCSYCYSRMEKNDELSRTQAQKVLKILVDNNVLFLNVGGGEPLLRKDLFELAAYATQLGLNISMNSNGYLLDKSAALMVKKAGFNNVGISIDSHEARAHDELRQMPGSYKRAVKAIKFLKETGVKVFISSVICRINFKEFDKLVSFAKELEVERINLHNYKCSGKGFTNKDRLDLKPDEWSDFYRRALIVQNKSKDMDIAFDDPILALLKKDKRNEARNPIGRILVKGSVCGKLTLYLKANADITPCGFIPLRIGNLLKDDFKELWAASPVLQSMRNKTPKGKCRKCKQYEDCWGGCTARAFAAGGDFNTPDPHCWYNPDGSIKLKKSKRSTQ